MAGLIKPQPSSTETASDWRCSVALGSSESIAIIVFPNAFWVGITIFTLRVKLTFQCKCVRKCRLINPQLHISKV